MPASALIPALLPAQCEQATSVDALTGKPLKPFNNWSPRGSATYDLFGDGKTSIHASASYYYAQRLAIASALSGIQPLTTLTWGANTANGSCTGTSCWTATYIDGIVQVSE